MKLIVVYRRWRYEPYPGLTVTREYERVMKSLTIEQIITFKHRIVHQGKSWRDGDPYDIVEIEINRHFSI